MRFLFRLFLFALILSVGPGTCLADSWNHEPPRATLHIHFWHHSTGSAWLSNGLRDALKQVYWDNEGTSTRSYLVSDYGYGGQNDYTDWRHWYTRFRQEVGVPGTDGKNYIFNAPQIPANEIAASNFMLTAYNYTRQSGDTIASPDTFDIVMFKPCYPGSAIYAYDTQFDAEGHVVGGTPWSDSNHASNNYTYLDSAATPNTAYTNTYWPAKSGVSHSGGAWSSSSASLAQLKVAYRGMLSIFHEHPEVLWVAVQAPPMTDLTAENVAASRELARWFREDWLHEWDPTGQDQFQDYTDKNGKINVVCFDYYNTMAYTTDDPVLDGEYFWFPLDFSWPDEFMDWEAPHLFVSPGLGSRPLTSPSDADNQPMPPTRTIGESRKMDSDSHPSSNQHYHAVDVFVGLKRNAESQGYRSWINAVTNRWLGADIITLNMERLAPERMRLTWTSAPGSTFQVWGGSDPQNLTVLDTVPSQGSTTSWTDEQATGTIKYYTVIRP